MSVVEETCGDMCGVAGDEAAEEKEAVEEDIDEVPLPLPRSGVCTGERLLARDLRDKP